MSILNGNLDRFLQPQPQQAQMVLAQPFNDIQLVALVAAQHCNFDDPAACVRWAQEIVAEAVVTGTRLAAMIQAKKEAAAKAAQA